MKKISSLCLLAGCLFFTACKNPAKPMIHTIWSLCEHRLASNESRLHVEVAFYNSMAGIEVNIQDWHVKIFANETLLFDFTRDNYKNFHLPVLASHFWDYYGNGTFKMGVPDNLFLNWISGDIFNGANATRIEVMFTLKDINNNLFELSGENSVDFDRE